MCFYIIGDVPAKCWLGGVTPVNPGRAVTCYNWGARYMVLPAQLSLAVYLNMSTNPSSPQSAQKLSRSWTLCIWIEEPAQGAWIVHTSILRSRSSSSMASWAATCQGRQACLMQYPSHTNGSFGSFLPTCAWPGERRSGTSDGAVGSIGSIMSRCRDLTGETDCPDYYLIGSCGRNSSIRIGPTAALLPYGMISTNRSLGTSSNRSPDCQVASLSLFCLRQSKLALSGVPFSNITSPFSVAFFCKPCLIFPRKPRNDSPW
ncbi:hypothetical protein T310_9626 [Rasamsonia emersonii CBS 393.64]|uniref:Uncharacterized protein n=1 Tax=Rasamsonia emersonii (strain ATCC 16479 / CBS 393.64 / IMI 116815) TaxID=1408163 RepID=A0A0F4YFU5_RASE3|nr:hypothetical protein T310_9626 [Rasamsonia emersonii CBS 393.64]KKA16806.1 hypothetical protein T310_9626 [Rasamsonia emersonii CBS 393.64]